MRTTITTQSAKTKPKLSKANERFKTPERFHMPEMLFDEYWRMGELAMMFGQAGVGKSILAVQVADALARGRALDGFRMPAGMRRVLYVDLKMSDKQFQMRYSRRAGPGVYPPYETYRFADNLYRDRPDSPEELCDWLEEVLPKSGVLAVVIDDISSVGRSSGDTRGLLAVMRRLRRLAERFRVGILVLADAAEPGKSGLVSEADLRRTRMLCSAADSVFAIGHHPQRPGQRYIVQTRSANAPIFWTTYNAPICVIEKDEKAMLRFKFDDRFSPYISPDELTLIRRVKGARNAGITFREIEAKFGISKSQAARLMKKWTPAMGSEEFMNDECGMMNDDAGGNPTGREGALLEEDSEEPCESPRVSEGDTKGERLKDKGESEEPQCESPRVSEGDIETQIEVASEEPGSRESAVPRRRRIRELKRELNASGTEIFIESENTIGQPEVWYQIDSKGNYVRYRRRMYAVNVDVIGRSPYLPV